MIIKDTRGRKLELTDTHLIEMSPTRYEGKTLWKAQLSDIEDLWTMPLTKTNPNPGDGPMMNEGETIKINNFSKRRLGCRTFSPATFAKILKAASVRKTKHANGTPG